MHTRDITAVTTALIILGGLLLARLMGNVGLYTLNTINESVFVVINGLSRFVVVAMIAPVITQVGDKITIAIILAVCLVFSLWMRPLRVWVVGMCVAVGFVAVCIVLLKPLYHVNRPITTPGISLYYYSLPSWYIGVSPVPQEMVQSEHRDTSFPSGHATVAFALAGVFWHARRWRWPIVLLATLVGISRISIGVHFPADVLAGSALGFLIGFLTMHWLEGQGEYAIKIRTLILKDVNRT